LDQALAGLPRTTDPNLLVGFETSDDAGVYRLTEECALVQTVDFFTPIVDDPFIFGAIAAANSLSDVYAMGGRPLTALSILAYPGKGDLSDLREILRGGAEKIQEAGCVLVGGHSINDEEIKFGYSVTGVVHPSRVLANASSRPGDVLVLTKRIGTGVISTALKRGIARPEHIEAAIDSMLLLNRIPEVAAHGCTDITGFGLLGHTREMAVASSVTVEIDAMAVQFLPGAVEYSAAGAQPGGLKNNREFVSPCVGSARQIPPEIEALLYDPQTSGGLLLSLHEAAAEAFMADYPAAFRVGRVLERGEDLIRIVLRRTRSSSLLTSIPGSKRSTWFDALGLTWVFTRSAWSYMPPPDRTF
jgi:selenide,water dikinase